MTDLLQGDKYITLHYVWLKYLDINDLLKETETEEIDLREEDSVGIVTAMKKIGRTYVDKNKKDMEPCFEDKTMTFLTPVYKKLSFLQYRSRVQLHMEIEAYIAEHYQDEDSQSDVTQTVDGAIGKFC